MMPDRHPIVLLTVLPKERRARHPYQLCPMFALIFLSAWQLFVGPVPTTAITVLSQHNQDLLNWYALFGGLAGVAAAFMPERIVRWRVRREHKFDVTWFRLWIELGCHGLLFFVWASYMVAISVKVPVIDGLTLSSVLVLSMAVAAVWRSAQILWTVKRAVLDPVPNSGIISINDLPNPL